MIDVKMILRMTCFIEYYLIYIYSTKANLHKDYCLNN